MADGLNAFTWTTAPFVVPVIGLNVTIAVANANWPGNRQILFIEFAGYYEVQSVPSATSIIVKNLGYTGNTAVGITIPPEVQVAPGGVKGADGSQTGTAGGDLEGTYPDPTLKVTTTKGDLIVNQNGVTAPRNTRLSVGSDGQVIRAKAAEALGMEWADFDLSGSDNALSGQLPIANGGTAAATAAAARTSLAVAKNGDNSDITSLSGLTTPLSIAQGGTGQTTAPLARYALNKTLPRYGLLGSAIGVNANSANTDTEIPMDSARYRIDKVVIENASTSLTTATIGVFTNIGGAGTVVAANQAMSALTASSKFDDLTLEAVAGTDVFTAVSLYSRIGTAQGSAATVNVWVFGYTYAV